MSVRSAVDTLFLGSHKRLLLHISITPSATFKPQTPHKQFKRLPSKTSAPPLKEARYSALQHTPDLPHKPDHIPRNALRPFVCPRTDRHKMHRSRRYTPHARSTLPPPQILPQLPQFCGSKARLTQRPPHDSYPSNYTHNLPSHEPPAHLPFNLSHRTSLLFNRISPDAL